MANLWAPMVTCACVRSGIKYDLRRRAGVLVREVRQSHCITCIFSVSDPLSAPAPITDPIFRNADPITLESIPHPRSISNSVAPHPNPDRAPFSQARTLARARECDMNFQYKCARECFALELARAHTPARVCAFVRRRPRCSVSPAPPATATTTHGRIDTM